MTSSEAFDRILCDLPFLLGPIYHDSRIKLEDILVKLEHDAYCRGWDDGRDDAILEEIIPE